MPVCLARNDPSVGCAPLNETLLPAPGMSAKNTGVLLERRLAPLFGKAYCKLTANATTGICLALKAAGIQGRTVGVPNGVCVNVPLAVLYSGNTPVYLDIDPKTLGLSPKILSNSQTPLAAVVAVHAYGYPCDIDGILGWCRQHRVFLIEDVAAAQGAGVSKVPAGAFGDVAVVSFGAGKIIDAGGGGAVFADDPALLGEISRLERTLPDSDSLTARNLDEFSRYHTKLYNDHYGKDLDGCAAEFRARAIALRDCFIRRARPDAFAERLVAGLDTLEENLEQRARNATRLAARFTGSPAPGVVPFAAPSGSAIWRFNLQVEHGRHKLLRHLLGKGYKISSWFPSVDQFFEKRGESGIRTPNSDHIGDTILNIWVNYEIDESYLSRIGDDICAFANVPLR